MRVYLDASALVSMISGEPTAGAVLSQIRLGDAPPLISDFATAESSAALAKLGRTGAFPVARLRELYSDLDRWALTAAEEVAIVSSDIAAANALVRRPEVSLRAPDAIHIAAAHRLGATLLTLDRGMARAAAALGVPYLNPAEADAPGEPKD
ncbi:type II toxin-antitoxin system VapC family toxin [Brevundimonas aurifodinae]|uniref:Ribonuclease VapC n=2 Tax=Brevundimonas TaxID=41275 RepID=A0ABV1NRZ2_9CAUL|nr:MAG: hypothetical protein B7Z42_12085 [Brevundimonas sp. 12-68-7]OYX29539.1 MAG: hypothetical protein B7Z01_15575 [Brevundimonas subvibrioides]